MIADLESEGEKMVSACSLNKDCDKSHMDCSERCATCWSNHVRDKAEIEWYDRTIADKDWEEGRL
jgi:hypothetical protein